MYAKQKQPGYKKVIGQSETVIVNAWLHAANKLKGLYKTWTLDWTGPWIGILDSQLFYMCTLVFLTGL